MPHRAIIAVILLATACLLPARAQVTVEQDVTTDTVDLFAKNAAAPKKSAVLAMCASVILPGLGHQYLGDDAKALIYYSAEALFIFGAIACDHYSKTIFNSAKAYAWEHAQAQGGQGADDNFWNNVGQYDESDGYNENMARGYNEQMELIYRDQEKDYLTPNLQWHWDDPANRKTYNGFLQQSLSWQVASSFFLGAMVLDRLVAFIDARVTAKNMETKALSSIKFVPQYDPQARASGLTLNISF
ncbi:MAG TPA: hypothetical protein VLX68_03575 [Chitinivibrionales bacterium]|nr:hypothetical protein [Chitinivibrionales bacterium]